MTKWKMVPVEPDAAMVEAGGESLYGYPLEKAIEWAKREKFESAAYQATEVFRAMVDKAPEAAANMQPPYVALMSSAEAKTKLDMNLAYGAGALLLPLVPQKWLLAIYPDHPAYPEIFSEVLREWPRSAVERMCSDGMHPITQQYAKVELNRRPKSSKF